MSRLIHVTDIHARSSSPEGRSDPDFVATVQSKLMAIAVWGMNNGVDAILCTGDLTHTPVPGHRVLRMLAKIIQYTRIPWYMTLGQHDIFGYNFQDHDTIAAYLLAEAMPDLFHVLPNGWEGQAERVGDLVVAGLHVSTSGHEMLPDALRSWEGKADIVMAHVMLTPTESPFAHIAVAKVPLVVPFLLVGDYHPGVYVHSDDKFIINPGALVRLKRTESEMKRTPMFAVIDFDKTASTRSVQFLSPPYQEDVWVSSEEQVGISDDLIQKFVLELASLGSQDFTMHTVEQLIQEAARRVQARPEVEAYAIARVKEILLKKEAEKGKGD